MRRNAVVTTAQRRLPHLVPAEGRASCRVVEIEPEGEFVLYGIGVPLSRMREPAAARARVPGECLHDAP